MNRVVYINDADDVFAYLRCFHPERGPTQEDIAQRFFARDHRNGWDTWLITLRASPVLWANARVPGITELESVGHIGT